MLELSRDILIDIGNTRTKYVYSDSKGQLSDIHTLPRNEVPLTVFEGCRKAVVASVANQSVVDGIKDVARQAGVNVIEVSTSKEAFGVTCPYEEPETLGIDRWLCALAVAKSTTQPTAILDLGTAATCDFVVNGRYLGGWIAPGFELMRNSLVTNTEQIFADQAYPEQIKVGQSTEECVNQGCLAMLTGLLLQTEQTLSQFDGEALIVMLGGSADMIIKATNKPVRKEPNLVFQGLRLFL